MATKQSARHLADAFWDEKAVGIVLGRLEMSGKAFETVRELYRARVQMEEDYSQRLLKLQHQIQIHDNDNAFDASLQAVVSMLTDTAASHGDFVERLRTLDRTLGSWTTEPQTLQKKKIDEVRTRKDAQFNMFSTAKKNYMDQAGQLEALKKQMAETPVDERQHLERTLQECKDKTRAADRHYQSETDQMKKVTNEWIQQWETSCNEIQEMEAHRAHQLLSSLKGLANGMSELYDKNVKMTKVMTTSLEQVQVDGRLTDFVTRSCTSSARPEPPQYKSLCDIDAPVILPTAEDDLSTVMRHVESYLASEQAPSRRTDPPGMLALQTTPTPIPADSPGERPRSVQSEKSDKRFKPISNPNFHVTPKQEGKTRQNNDQKRVSAIQYNEDRSRPSSVQIEPNVPAEHAAVTQTTLASPVYNDDTRSDSGDSQASGPAVPAPVQTEKWLISSKLKPEARPIVIESTKPKAHPPLKIEIPGPPLQQQSQLQNAPPQDHTQHYQSQQPSFNTQQPPSNSQLQYHPSSDHSDPSQPDSSFQPQYTSATYVNANVSSQPHTDDMPRSQSNMSNQSKTKTKSNPIKNLFKKMDKDRSSGLFKKSSTTGKRYAEADLKPLCTVQANWTYEANPDAPVDEMSFEQHKEFEITYKNEDGWWFALNSEKPGGGGWVPGNYMKIITDRY